MILLGKTVNFERVREMFTKSSSGGFPTQSQLVHSSVRNYLKLLVKMKVID
jgi:hypothetical protein